MSDVQVVRWIGVPDEKALCEEAAKRISAAATEAIKARGRFIIVLAGGSTPRAVYKLLCNVHTDWSRWQVFFGDERCLAADDCGRNSRMASKTWLRHVAIPIAQVHAIPAERGAHAAAVAYARTLRRVGLFDLVLLGLGEDGHTASLFGDVARKGSDQPPDVISVFDAPKPPAERVSLSAERLGRARAVLFLVAGETKREAVAQWQNQADVPAGRVCPAVGVDVLVESTLLGPTPLAQAATHAIMPLETRRKNSHPA